jgi:hypothetical protein
MSTRASMTRAEVTRIDEVSLSQMKTRLEHWGSQLDALEPKVFALGGSSGGQIREDIKRLKAKVQIARVWFDAFNGAGTARWGLFRFCIQSSWSDFHTTLEGLRKQVALEDTPKNDDT